MQTFQVECYTHQTPFASGGPQATQRALAKAQDVFDNAQHRFDCTFAQAVDRAANLGLEFVSHLHLWTGICGRWRGLLRKIRLPTGMMGYTPVAMYGSMSRASMAAMLVALKYPLSKAPALGVPKASG